MSSTIKGFRDGVLDKINAESLSGPPTIAQL